MIGDYLIVHGTHHRAGTLWFEQIFRDIASEYLLKFQRCRQAELEKDTIFFLEEHSRINLKKLDNVIASHMIRDPRDMCISGYFYHKKCKESWVLSNDSFDWLIHRCGLNRNNFPRNINYQSALNSMDVDDGIAFELLMVTKFMIIQMINFNKTNSSVKTIKYEDFRLNPQDNFHNLFKYYNFSDEEIDICLQIADKYNIDRLISTDDPAHVSGGRIREFKKFFTDKHFAVFQDITKTLDVKFLDYDFDDNHH
jgi:hypothetical protein